MAIIHNFGWVPWTVVIQRGVAGVTKLRKCLAAIEPSILEGLLLLLVIGFGVALKDG
jgi:hypothetical protein